MKKLIIATGLLMATSAHAQTEVLTGVTRGKDYGVVYALPKTQQVCRPLFETDQYLCRTRRILGTEQRESEAGRSTQQRSYLLRQTERQNGSSSHGTD